MEVAMTKFIRKFFLGSASVLVLGIGGTALDYAADAGNTVAAASRPAASQPSESLRSGDYFRKDDIRWAQAELRFRGLYKGSLDGVLGPETRRALAGFQTHHGLDQTASLDAQTWEALTSQPDSGQGSSISPDSDRAGAITNSSSASHLGR
jgi:peptidoglycan hydrolase-like protein with peptidoglycan-binding domain